MSIRNAQEIALLAIDVQQADGHVSTPLVSVDVPYPKRNIITTTTTILKYTINPNRYRCIQQTYIVLMRSISQL